MARVLQQIETCDWCKLLGLEAVEAERSVNLAIDGPPKRFEFCAIHLVQLKPLLHLVQDDNFGVNEALKRQKRGSKKEPQELAAPKPEEEQPSPWFRQTDPIQAQELAPPPKKRTTKGATAADILLSCPLAHASTNGGPKQVKYKDRAKHAADHDLKVWEVEWGDPSGALTVPCTEHAVCQQAHLAFPSEHGVKMHIKRFEP